MPQDQDPKLDNGEQKLNSGAPGASGHPSSPAAKGDAQQKAAKADEFDGALAQLRSDRDDEEEDERFVEQDSRSVETHRPDDRIVVAAAGGALYEEAAGNSAREDLTLIGDDLAEDGDSGGDAEGRSGQRDDGADSVLLGERGSSLLTAAAPETVEAPSGRENPAEGPSGGIARPQDVQSQASPTESDDDDAGQGAAPTLEAAPLTDNEDQQDDESAEEETDDGAPEGPPVQDEDEAPTDIWMSETSLAENADGAVIGTLGVADADSTSHSYSVSDPRFEVVGSTLKLKDGVSLDYEAEGGSLSVTVTVTDSDGNSYSEAFTLTLTDENDSGQVFTSGGSASASENVSDGVVIYTAAATDIDTTGEAITFSLTDDAGGLFEIDPNTGEVTLTDGLSLDFDTMASHDITIQSSDGVNTTNHTVTITVDDIAEAVTLADGGVVFNDDGVSEISITGGDGDDTINALDGDDLISGGAGDDAIDGGDGADIVQFSGNWADYTITENAGVYTVVHKNAGADGTDTVTNVETFRFADGDVAAADVLNDGPVANADAGSLAEDAVSVSGDVLANDTDADISAGVADTLTVAEIGGEAGDVGSAVTGTYGSVTLNADGSYSYSLDNGNGAVQALNVGDSLTDSFTYTVTDEHGATSTATLSITIDGTNDGPVANADAASIAEDAASVAGDVLSNDTDADTGATLTVAEIGGQAGDVGNAVAGSYGSVTLNADGSYSYSLDNGNGAVQALNVGDSLTDSFTYTVTDEHGATSTATLSITIDGTNDGPVANADAASIAEDAASVAGDVLSNDTDADTGATLTVAEIGGQAGDVGNAVAGSYGSVTLNADGSYSYSLDNGNGAVQALNVGDSLTDSFTYTVTDEHGATSTATLSITIDGTNDGPVANADAASIGVGDRPVIGPIDGDGERGGGGGAMLIRHRVGEAIRQAVADIQRLHRAIAIVEAVGIGAIGVQRHRAVASRNRIADIARLAADLGDSERGAGIGVGVVAQHIARDGGRIFRDAGRIGVGDRPVIGPIDGDGERGGGGGAMLIRHRVGEAVRQAVADIQRLHRAIAIVEAVGIGAIGVQRHRAVASRNRIADIARLAADLGDSEGCAGIGVGVVAQHIARDGGRIFRDAGRIGVGDRPVIGPIDGDGERGGGGGAMLIRHRVGEAVRQAVADIQRLHRAIAIVEAVGIGAIGVQRHRAVASRNRIADIARLAADLGDSEGCAGIGVGVVAQHIARDGGRIFRDAGRIGVGDRPVIGPIDGDGERGGGGGAMLIRHRVGEAVRQAVADIQRLHRAIAIVEAVGIGAIGVQRHRAVASRNRMPTSPAWPPISATVRVAPVSASVSLLSTSPATEAASSAMLAASALATGPSLVPSMVMESVAVEVAPCSSVTV